MILALIYFSSMIICLIGLCFVVNPKYSSDLKFAPWSEAKTKLTGAKLVGIIIVSALPVLSTAIAIMLFIGLIITGIIHGCPNALARVAKFMDEPVFK